ncbi:hypothetical protein DFH06DRAFT_1092768 [Mycena polygramma]|nr:hypothetical protein DFH06DRAFT_1092768 [Mycena polygramma]
MACSICYEKFTAPVSLPCGHIFCCECIRRTVEASQKSTMQHVCPTCRAGYNAVSVDPALVPAYLRPYILPTIRPMFFDAPVPASASTSTSADAAKPDDEVSWETYRALLAKCEMWRQRAEAHATGNARLLSFARTARQHALSMRAERDEALARYAELEGRLSRFITATQADAFVPDQARLQYGERPAAPVSSPLALPMSRPGSSLGVSATLANAASGPPSIVEPSHHDSEQ